MKATDLLTKQHRKVEEIFHKLEHGRGAKEPLVLELANNLVAHMGIEQDIFYPAVKRVDEDLVNESFEEHAIAEFALKRLLATSATEDIFDARVVALKELIQHHVKEEEEELFPAVEKKLGAEELTAMGEEMQALFERLVAKGCEAVLPKSYAKTTSDKSRAHV